MVKASMAGMAGLTLPNLLQSRAEAARVGRDSQRAKSVILLWMTGGPSQIDTWDPKPDRPLNNRGPFGVIKTKLPGVFICEHLPKQAAMLDRFTIIRSVDAKFSNHEPNMVFQTGNLDAEPRINREAKHFPSIASIVAKHRSTSHPVMPPYVGFYRSPSHIAFGGYAGQEYDPFQGNMAAKLPVYDLVGNHTGRTTNAELFQFPKGLDFQRLGDRRALLKDIDRIRRDIDSSGAMEATDAFQQQAVDLLLGKQARDAFDLALEPSETRSRYGDHLWCQQALLARRLVEAGVAFVTIDLSYHTASGTWDNHGDNVPPYGGISRGLKPLLPLFDHLVTTLVSDLEERGRLDDVLIIAMGEFGPRPLAQCDVDGHGWRRTAARSSNWRNGEGWRHHQRARRYSRRLRRDALSLLRCSTDDPIPGSPRPSQEYRRSRNADRGAGTFIATRQIIAGRNDLLDPRTKMQRRRDDSRRRG
jgi:hypothetical protein